MTGRTRQTVKAPGRGTWAGVLLPCLELGLAAALLAALGIFHVWSRTQVLEAGYQLSTLQAEHSRLVATQDQLEIELGMLTSPRVLEEAARTKLAKLGLALPARGAVWAAVPDRDDPGRAGGKGVDHPPRPAGPISKELGRREVEARAILSLAADPRKAAAEP
jgi:hypothetical protein